MESNVSIDWLKRRTEMERLPKGAYTPEFREQAVRLPETEGLTLRESARRLSLPVGTLRNWVYAARQGKLSEVGKNQKSPSELEMELARVKRELAEVRMERDLLKKAAAYFARGSR
jgi:transposase